MALPVATKGPSFPNSFAVTRKFIKFVEQYPALHGRHSKRTADVCWTRLEQIMGIPKKALMSKWRRLRDTYRRELRSECAVGPGQHYITDWPFFEQLHFLRPIILRSFAGSGAIPAARLRVQENRTSIPKVMAAPGNGGNQSKPTTPPTVAGSEEPSRHASGSLPEPLDSFASETIGSDYELLMTHIYPYLQAIPVASKPALYSKILELVYWEHRFAQSCRRPKGWMGSNALDDDELLRMMQLDDPFGLGHTGAL
uniref:MADF domain-containing protein n=1 Tax=Anopheles albimanus TaxID=7167 RepID=A0A182FBH8_ANOAL